MTLVRKRALVSGRVQGVGFRWCACEKAEHLGLTGWVQNLPDGRVELEYQGDSLLVEEMSLWLKKGPALARVRQVTFWDERLKEGERGFGSRW